MILRLHNRIGLVFATALLARIGMHLDAMRADTEAFHDLNRQQVATLSAASFQRFDLARALSIAITLLGLAVAGALWWLTARDIVSPLRALQEAATAISGGRSIGRREALLI